VSRSQEEVQGTINKIITSEHLTVVVIAHRCGARISFIHLCMRHFRVEDARLLPRQAQDKHT
jgi:hypothetical protein